MSADGAKERIERFLEEVQREAAERDLERARKWKEARRWAEEHSWTGERCDPERPLKETAKLLLADIRAAVRARELPPGVGPHAWRTY